MSALDKVVSAHQHALSLTQSEQEDEQREAAALLLAHAATGGLAEASRLILAGSPVPAQLILSASVALQGLELPPPELALSDWVEHTAMTLAADGGTSQGAGETYADPGHQSDGKKRYPVTKGGKPSEERIRAAWSYINQGDNASQYSSADLAKIKSKIKSAGKSAGIQFDEDADDKKMAASNVMLAAQAPMVESEILHVKHRPMHGVHEHAHIHLDDNRHGPSRVALAMAAGGGWGGAGNIKAISSAYIHKPMTGAHIHKHVHAGDGTHGPLQELGEDAADKAGSSW